MVELQLQNRKVLTWRAVFMLAMQLAIVHSQRMVIVNAPGYHTDVLAGVMHAFKNYFQNNMSHVLFNDHSSGTLDFLEAGMGTSLVSNGSMHAIKKISGPQLKVDRARLPAKVDVAVFITPEHDNEEGLKVKPLFGRESMHTAVLGSDSARPRMRGSSRRGVGMHGCLDAV